MNHPLLQIQHYYVTTILLVKCNPTDNPTDFNWGCCTEMDPCYKGRGDCDKDSECVGDLVCGNNNCGDGAHPELDCCVDKECNPAKNDWHCCTASNPCGPGKGDCDNDDDCAGDLVCGDHNCGDFEGDFFFAHPNMDCCASP